MKPRKRDIYAVETGRYAGEMWVFCGSNTEDYFFLSIPIMENRYVKKELFDNGMKGEAVKHIEKVPRYVYKVSREQFLKNEKASNN